MDYNIRLDIISVGVSQVALGKRRVERQGEFGVAAADLAIEPWHVFYEKLNAILAEADFDDFVEELCEPFYAHGRRPPTPPGVFFRMMYLGYFEGIDSQRGIACRCEDSLSIRRFGVTSRTKRRPGIHPCTEHPCRSVRQHSRLAV